MTDSADAGGDAQISFKVKTSSDTTHSITMAESATVLELKTKLSAPDSENVPIERQRLIYSGRVMKNDDSLGSYNIKPNNTIHMVKSAASNPAPPSSGSGSAATAQAVPTNMASGTANNPLAGLTGARFAGHQINLPGMDVFGPDGGMGPPMDEERIQRMMSDPNVQQSMNEALSNPDFVNMLIESNPMLRNMPNAREIITSPFMRQMMSNPQMMSQAIRMQRNMRGADAAFPAPGATNTTPGDAPAAGDADSRPAALADGFQNPFAIPGMGGPGLDGGMNINQMLQALNGLGLGSFGAPGGTTDAAAAQAPASGDGQGAPESGSTDPAQSTNPQGQAAANPFAALFPPPSGAASTAADSFGMNPELYRQQMMQLLGVGAPPAAPPDTRPPEERYAEQLRQLNDMGFCEFERNVAALRRSGGSVQGAVEHLLSSTD